MASIFALVWFFSLAAAIVFIIKTIREKDPTAKAGKRKIWLICFAVSVVSLIVVGVTSPNKEETAKDTTKETSTEKSAKDADDGKSADTQEEAAPLYDTQIENDFAALVEEFGAEITEGTFDLAVSDDGAGTLMAGVLIENNEDTVNSFLKKTKKLIKASEECDSAIITFGDISQGKDSEVLLMASIENNKIKKSMESANFKTAHNEWIQDQFSAWDGSHIELTKLIKQSLNDEDSYKHIKTTYLDIETKKDVKKVNKILSDAGKSQTVKKKDLLIMTEFSAKNGFNATIKSTAYGIASYEDNTITLISIE